MRILPFAMASALVAASLSAQSTATFDLYGQGCNGGGLSQCIVQNDQSPLLTGSTLPNEYCHAVTNSNAFPVAVIGFDIYTRTAAGGQATVQAGIYRDASGTGALAHTTPALVAESVGTVTADGADDWYTATCYPAMIVQPGETFWIGADTNAILAPDNGNGVPGPAPSYWRRPPFGGTAWTVTGIVNNPAYRMNCMGNGPVPYMANTGTPRLGNSMQFDLTEITNGARLTFFAVASDNTQWIGFPTPVDLSIVGAPDCFTYTAADEFVDFVLPVAGAASYTLNIPNDPNLDGFTFYTQWFVFDTAYSNLRGLGASNAGEGTIGVQ